MITARDRMIIRLLILIAQCMIDFVGNEGTFNELKAIRADYEFLCGDTVEDPKGVI